MQRTRRVKIVTGLKCNIQCVFCYYRDNLNAPNRSLPDIFADIHYAYQHGVREIDFSGGEPTIHPALLELISKAKQIGMERVCIITNGLRLANNDYLLELKKAGLDEVLFSVHGPSAEIHDEITQCSGSFNKLTAALGNASASGLTVRVNTVVNRINYESLTSLGQMLIRFSPVQVNFITINDWCFAKNLVDRYMLPYTDMAPRLKEVCDLLEPHVAAVNVRYIPFCFMQGYERFVCNHRQVPFDPYEWVPRVRARLEEGTGLWRYLAILGYGLLIAGEAKNFVYKKFPELLDSAITEGLRKRFYTMADCCKSCRFYELCDGVEKTYSREYGVSELVSQAGSAITDPMYFRRVNSSCCTRL